jgi:hypothetical protein
VTGSFQDRFECLTWALSSLATSLSASMAASSLLARTASRVAVRGDTHSSRKESLRDETLSASSLRQEPEDPSARRPNSVIWETNFASDAFVACTDVSKSQTLWPSSGGERKTDLKSLTSNENRCPRPRPAKNQRPNRDQISHGLSYLREVSVHPRDKSPLGDSKSCARECQNEVRIVSS